MTRPVGALTLPAYEKPAAGDSVGCARPQLGRRAGAVASRGPIVRLDPAADAIIPAGAVIEKVKDGFGFVEAPIWVEQGESGYLLFSDVPSNLIHKLTPDGMLSVFLEHADWSDASLTRPEKPRFGANGIALDALSDSTERSGEVNF